ncbi:hypothetical protein [Zhongshania sp. BJYM1]|uniref:hypothetical protein n=1 Tax=Zhongshania aquatica TaxID=2965069 RepID=UPI0022B5DBA3|nr:hypothetical protein [Marortus sp. BJYM1]
MQLGELQILFDAGNLKSCTAVRYVLSNEWTLQFDRKLSEPVLMAAQRVSPRRFKTLDAAYKACTEVGFIGMEVAGP